MLLSSTAWYRTVWLHNKDCFIRLRNLSDSGPKSSRNPGQRVWLWTLNPLESRNSPDWDQGSLQKKLCNWEAKMKISVSSNCEQSRSDPASLLVQRVEVVSMKITITLPYLWTINLAQHLPWSSFTTYLSEGLVNGYQRLLDMFKKCGHIVFPWPLPSGNIFLFLVTSRSPYV